MARSSRKGRAGNAGPQAKTAKRPRALPPPESITSVEEFTSPKSGKTYLAIESTETDAYDKVKQDKVAKPRRAKKKRGAGS